MSWGVRALSLAVLALPASATLTGCGVDGLGGGHAGVRGAGYQPLTERTFAQAMTLGMTDLGTAHLDMEIGEESMSLDMSFGDEDDIAFEGIYDDGEVVGEIVLVDGEVFFRQERAPVYFQAPDYLADQLVAQMEMGNPAAMADRFEDGIESLDYVGTYPGSAGAPTHRYDLTMSKEFLSEEMDVPLERVPDVQYRIWLDEDHLMRRVTTWAYGHQIVVEFSGWGRPLRISPPPPDLVEPMPVPTDEA